MVIYLEQGADDLHMVPADATATPSSHVSIKFTTIFTLLVTWKKGH